MRKQKNSCKIEFPYNLSPKIKILQRPKIQKNQLPKK